MTSDAHQVCYFNETRRSIKRLIKVVFSISIWSAVGLAGQVGSPFEGDLLSHELIVLHYSRRPVGRAASGRYSTALHAAPRRRHKRGRRRRHYQALLLHTRYIPERRESLAWFTMATFTLILWSHVVHIDAIFS